MFKLVWSELVQTYMNFWNLFELFQSCMNFFKFLRSCINLYKLAWTFMTLYELVQIGLNMYELVQTCPKIIFRKPQKPTNFWWSQHSDTFTTEMDFLLIQRKTEVNLLLLPPQLMILTQNIIFIGKNGLLTVQNNWQK